MRALEAPPSYHAATAVDDSPAVLTVETETAQTDGAQALDEPQSQASIPQATARAIPETQRSITTEEVVDFNGNFDRSETAEDLEVIPLQDL